MSFQDAVQQISGITPLSSLDNAWRFSTSARFVRFLCLNSGGTHAFQWNTIDRHDEDLACAVLTFARHNEPILTSGDAFSVARGFTFEPAGFDIVAAVPDQIHGSYEFENTQLSGHVTAVFPAFQCEISGTEKSAEAQMRYKKMLHSGVMTRTPSAYLRMRYDNPKTQGGSIGKKRGFTEFANLSREIGLLADSPQAFIEFETYETHVWTIVWDQTWKVSGYTTHDFTTEEQAIAWATNSCYGPNVGACGVSL